MAFQSASDLAKQLYAQFQKAVPAVQANAANIANNAYNFAKQDVQRIPIVQQATAISQAKPINFSGVTQGINSVGKFIGQQPFINTPVIKSPTNLQAFQGVAKLNSGQVSSPITSFLSGNVQKIPNQIKSGLSESYGPPKPGESQQAYLQRTGGGVVGAVNPIEGTEKYLAELAAEQKLAKGATTSPLLANLKAKLAEFKAKLVDSTSPIEDVLSEAQKKGKYEILTSKNIHDQIDRATRSPELAGQFLKDNGLADVIRQAPDLHALNQYLIAKHAADVGVKTGRNAAKDAQLLQDLAPTYEPLAQKVTQYGQKLLDYATETGLVSKDVATMLKQKYPNYVPLNRIFSELEKTTVPEGAGVRGVASLSKQTVVQKLKGSERAIQDPIESLLLKTKDAFSQGERNQAGQMLASYKDLPGNPLNITPLRTAENVNKRIDLYSQAKDLKPIQTKLYSFIKTRGKQIRQLQSQVNQLESKGLNISLKQKASEAQQPLTSAIKTKYTPGNITFGEGDVVTGGNLPKTKILGDVYATQKNKGSQSTKKFIDDLITDPNRDIQQLKKQVATRENKLGPLLDEVQVMRDSLEGVKAQRGSLFDEAKLLQDAKSKGLDTFSTFKNGTKEIYQTTPEIASAAKFLDKRQLGFVGNLFALPTRIARIGITGINLPFVASNVPKDQVSAFINSDKALQTSIANPGVFLKSAWNAIGHGKEYDNWIRSAGGGTSFDISRSAPETSVAQIRAGRNKISNVAYTVTHPAQLLRTVENIVNRGEEVTRLQQYIGTKQALLKQGRTPQDAEILAARASRENTVNFARSGDWGKALNSVFLYLNAGIQGSRTLVRNLQTRPIQTSAKIALSVLTPVAAVTAWNLSDPERAKAYNDIQPFEKDNNLIIVPPHPTQDPKTGKWNVIKIPFSQEIASLTVPMRKSIEGLKGYDGAGFGDFAKAILGSTMSLNVDPNNPQQLVGQFIPQAVKPGLESALNKNTFTGQDIVPQYINGVPSKDLPPDQQVKPNTSGTARIIGKGLNTSPLKVEQFIKSSTGGVGSQLLNASDQALAATGAISKDQIGGQSIVQGIQSKFHQATGGEDQNKQYKDIGKYQAAQAQTTQAKKQTVDKVVTILTDPNTSADKKRAILSVLSQKSNSDTFTAVRRALKDKLTNVSSSDKAVRGLNSEQRAKYTLDHLKTLTTPEEKRAFVKELAAKGILTKSVIAELKKQLSQ